MISTPLRDRVFVNHQVSIPILRTELGLDLRNLASVLGVPYNAVCKKNWAVSSKVQSRARDMVLIIDRVTDWAGSREQAFAWYRSQLISALGMTAEQAVKTGRSDLVWFYLDAITEGGFA